MSFIPPHHSDFTDPLPPNQPIFAPDEVGAGWRRVRVGEVVKTHYQYFALHPRVTWKLSAYFTAEGLVNDGRATYRGPVSLRAWGVVMWALVPKLWKHYVKKEI